MAHRAVGTGISFAITSGTATTSTAFPVQSSVLRIVAEGGDAHVSVGPQKPVATVADYYIPANGTASIALTKASNRVTGITTSGTTTIIDFAEGTQCPFGEGDYITVQCSDDQPYYNFAHKPITSINVSNGISGYFQGRCIVDNDYGVAIATAFNARDARAIASNTLSVYTGDMGVVCYAQQIQVTGDA